MRNTALKSGFDLSIRNRLLAGFIAITVPVIIVLLIFIVKTSSIDNVAQHLVSISLPTQKAIGDLDATINDSQATLYDYLLTKNVKSKIKHEYVWSDIQKIQGKMDVLSTTWAARAFAKGWEELKPNIKLLKLAQDKLLTLSKSGSATTADISQFIASDIQPILTVLSNLLSGTVSPVTNIREGGMLTEEAGFLSDQTQGLIHSITTLKWIGYGLLILSITLLLIIPFITSRSIVHPLHVATDIAKRIAAGERNIEIAIFSSKEIRELLMALSVMQNSIRENEDNIKMNEAKTRSFLENILKTAEKYSTHSSKLASGDLTIRLDITQDDVLAKLGEDLNSMTDSMSNVANKILDSSNSIFTTLEQVRSLSNSQSSGVTEQASSIQEITSSLEEIDKSSKQTMDKARNLGQVAKQTLDKGHLGIQSVEKSIIGMKTLHDKVQAISQSILELSAQTQQVGEITAVVNTLAQQSKMLALNASIEAAKAGEAGKGFAVVAIEVKNLAEQSEQSTAQVQKILEDIRHGAERSVMVTEEGTKGVIESSQLIQNASEVIHSLNDMITAASMASQQIEASIRQETISIEQITAGMMEINQVTTTFVAGVKETESSVNYLTNIAEKLKNYISIYKL